MENGKRMKGEGKMKKGGKENMGKRAKQKKRN